MSQVKVPTMLSEQLFAAGAAAAVEPAPLRSSAPTSARPPRTDPIAPRLQASVNHAR
jgi:hypothetical protein